jgi:HSP20 family protein
MNKEVNHPLVELHSQIDRLFDDLWDSFGIGNSLFSNNHLKSNFPTFVPELNISSDAKEYTITFEAAGLEQKDIAIELNERRLTIKGNKVDESENKEKDFYRIERRFGSFQRVLALPEDALVDDINAKMSNGLLTIRIPRSETVNSTTRKIEIKNS